MRSKKFLASAINHNSIRVYDAISHQVHRVISIDGTISSQPITEGNMLVVLVEKENQKFKHTYGLPHGNLIDSRPV